jgi:hypothetical protein
MVALFVFALLLLCAWFIAVVALHVTAAAIHLLLVGAIIVFAVGFIRRVVERPPLGVA